MSTTVPVPIDLSVAQATYVQPIVISTLRFQDLNIIAFVVLVKRVRNVLMMCSVARVVVRIFVVFEKNIHGEG